MLKRLYIKNIALISEADIEFDEKLNVLSGRTKKGDSYTEFHFGAGESSIIRMVTEIEQCEDNH